MRNESKTALKHATNARRWRYVVSLEAIERFLSQLSLIYFPSRSYLIRSFHQAIHIRAFPRGI